MTFIFPASFALEIDCVSECLDLDKIQFRENENALFSYFAEAGSCNFLLPHTSHTMHKIVIYLWVYTNTVIFISKKSKTGRQWQGKWHSAAKHWTKR